jgi:HEAT repeat protein
MHRYFPVLFFSATLAFSQTPKDVRAVAKQGQSAVPVVAQYLNSHSLDTRIETVKQLVILGGKDTIDPLIRATRDADAEMQIRATDGLVNYYLPGYVRTGLGSSVIRVGATIKAKFSDTNDQMIDPFVIVRPDVVMALGALARGGVDNDVRANACRAVGIVRGHDALPDVLDALKTKDNRVMYEALIAIQKIRDPQAGPRITYLLRDLDDKVQGAAIETAGMLRTQDALPSLRSIVGNPRNSKAERSALSALAMMPEPADHDLLTRELGSKDEKLRTAAAEGLGRLNNPSDEPVLNKFWLDDDKMYPRLAAAFALVMEGKLDLSPESPFRYLINTLNSATYKDTAIVYLTEAARQKNVLRALEGQIEPGIKDEKISLGRILAASGDAGSVPYLDKLSRDPDKDVATDGLRSLRSLRARLGV